MVQTYDEAAALLYQAPFAEFVAERKRLAAELKAAGDKVGAQRLARLTRPSIAAWAVNQLWWSARQDFEGLFAAARRLRDGDLSGTDARREAAGKLRARAEALLTQANQAASDTTLRRIATTLSALAAAGGFAPDAPGQLAADRDPPGFESAGSLEAAAARPPAPSRPRKPEDAPPAPRVLEEARRQRAADEARREREQSEARRARQEEAARERAAAEQRARRREERARLERSLRSLRSEIERRARDLERMRKELGDAEDELAKSRFTAEQIEARLATLEAEQ